MSLASMSPVFRIALILGSVLYLLLILYMLKHKKLTVRYSLIWLMSGVVLLLFALFPYLVLVLRDLLKLEMPTNVVFTMSIAFILLVSLSVSSAVSILHEKQKRLIQTQALLEKRVRELEEKIANTK